jgi:hypothetical protein
MRTGVKINFAFYSFVTEHMHAFNKISCMLWQDKYSNKSIYLCKFLCVCVRVCLVLCVGVQHSQIKLFFGFWRSSRELEQQQNRTIWLLLDSVHHLVCGSFTKDHNVVVFCKTATYQTMNRVQKKPNSSVQHTPSSESFQVYQQQNINEYDYIII